MLTVGSLFSGIGGLDLGLERAGMRVIWQSEIDSYACRVLAKHWPEVPNHGDIKRVDWADVARPDVLCGGYPCQPFSLAGARKGEEDPRHLWPWVREAIRVLRPRYAILENVRGHLSLGGPTVIGEIASLGYCAEWRIVSAASVGANHRRDRIIIVAYPDSWRSQIPNFGQQPSEQMLGSDGQAGRIGKMANTEKFGGHVRGSGQCGRPPGEWGSLQSETGTSGGPLADAESGVNVRGQRERTNHRTEVFGGDNLTGGTSLYAGGKWWETEPDVGRVAHGIPNRVDRLKGLGNAVVPQVAEVIGRLVMAHANANPTN